MTDGCILVLLCPLFPSYLPVSVPFTFLPTAPWSAPSFTNKQASGLLFLL